MHRIFLSCLQRSSKSLLVQTAPLSLAMSTVSTASTTSTVSTDMAAKYAKLPKVELHVHLDGACRLNTLRELSKEYGLPYPHDDVEAFKLWVALPSAAPSLVDFLKVFTALAEILRTEEALARVAYEYVEDLHRQNAVYAEIRYNPFSEVVGGPTGEQYCEGVIAGLERGEKEFGVKVRSILCFKRENPERCAEIVSLAHRYMSRGVVGVDIAGNELLPLDPRHIDGFLTAKKLGLHVTVHAGESGPAENVRQAIEDLGAERIGHGYHVLQNEDIYCLAREKKIHFEVCPTSSVYTSSTQNDNHASLRFARDGVSFSINTDDPGVMLCDLNGEYVVAERDIGLTYDQLKQLALAGAEAAFLPDQEKQEVVKAIRERLAALEHGHC